MLPGDTLRIRAQGEMTSDYQDPVSGSIRIVAAGNQVGTWMAQNAIADQSHHMPLWADAIVVADAAGALEIGAQWAASRGDASPEVTMESGYGHLVVEHYRAFPSVEAAAQAGALLLADTFSTSVALAGFYDGSASAAAPAEVYSASVAVKAGDRLHLLAQVSTSYTSSIEMQGQQIRGDGVQISPWSTSNHSASMPDLPLWTDAIDAPLAAGNRVYSAAVHGVAGVGGAILGGYGSLQGLRFSTAQAGALSYLGGTVDVMSAPTQVIANAPAQDLLARSVSVSAGDRLRVTGIAQLTHPPGFPGGISCTTRVVLQDGAGSEVASEIASKYVTPLLEALPLRGEIVVPVASAGAWVARLTLACSRQDDSPSVPVAGAWLLVEPFGH